MGKVTILPETTKKPITLMGRRAGYCWGGDVSDDKKNYERGLDCLKKNHGRVLEFVNIETVLEGWSARTMRQWYTHIGGAPTRLQASTRYINYNDFDYVIPDSINSNPQAKEIYQDTMRNASVAITILNDCLGIPREDTAMMSPLGMQTTVVDKRNLRNAIDMSHQRECFRTYWEFRNLLKKWKRELRSIDEEWAYLVDNYFKPKCEVLGYCPEGKACKEKFRKEDNNN